MGIQRDFLNILVADEIQQIVGRAARGSGFIRAGEQAYRLSKAFPNCGMTGSELVNEIVVAASRAGVAVEIHQPLPVAA